MKIYNQFIILIAILVFSSAQGQNKVCVLKAESDGKQVKLLWLMSRWDAAFKGFEIKRKIDNGAWQLLTKNYIKPEMSESKDLSNAIHEPTTLQRVSEKQKMLLSKGDRPTILNEAYLKKLTTDTGAIIGLLLAFAQDFDLALMNGFGFVDADIPRAKQVEYGLFLVTSDEKNGALLQSWTWQYGKSTLGTVPTKTSTKTNRAKDVVTIKWSFNGADLRMAGYHGFNIYKQDGNFILNKMNSTPIWKNGDKEMMHQIEDAAIGEKRLQKYLLKPVSAFGTEGKGIEIIYDSDKHVGELGVPKIAETLVKSELKYLEVGWEFDALSEKFIKGFIIQRRPNLDSAFVNVSGTIFPSIRSFKDSSRLTYESYYFYRVVAITIDPEVPFMNSNEFLYYYKPTIQPSRPKMLKGNYLVEEKKRYIELRWKNEMSELIKGYRIYASFPGKNYLTWQSDIKPIANGSYKFEIYNYDAASYQFAITQFSIFEDEGPFSDTITIETPSIVVPNVSIWPFKVDSNHVLLQWTYDSPSDLKSFTLYLDGKPLAELDGKLRIWEGNLEYNRQYKFELEANTLSGLKSRRSIPVQIKTPRKQNKK